MNFVSTSPAFLMMERKGFRYEFKAGRLFNCTMDNLPASGRQTPPRAGLVDVNGDGHNPLIDSGSGDRVSFVYIKFLSICAGFTHAARLEIQCQLI